MESRIPFFIASLRADAVEILEFYRYRTVVCERIAIVNRDSKESLLDTFFEEFRTKAEALTYIDEDGNDREGARLRDNKIAYKIRLQSGTILYVGFYDGMRYIGLSIECDDWIKPFPVKE